MTDVDSPSPQDSRLDELIGRTLGAYRIVRKIAEGGMGAVYEAVHAELGRRAAVKVLRPELLSSPESNSRFFVEAKAVSMVTHPSLVTIYDHGKSADGQAFIVMEYLDGESLRQRHERSYLGSSALPILRQLASALSVTHKKRIVHRDLKPDNIMLVPEDDLAGGERVKILDFGIAKVLTDGAPVEDQRMVKTRTGTLIGTPTYMSPEQCRASGPADEKTDVYALGVISFELLYGAPPFLSASAGELYAMHLFAPPPALRERVPGIEPKLAELVQRMLDKKPGGRPSMAEALAELQALAGTGLKDGSIEDRPSHQHEAARDDELRTSDVGPAQAEDILRGMANKTSPRESYAVNNTTSGSRGERVAVRRNLLRSLSLGTLLTLACLCGLFFALRPRIGGPASSSPVSSAPASAASALVSPGAAPVRPTPAGQPSAVLDGGVVSPSVSEQKVAPASPAREPGGPTGVADLKGKPGKLPRAKKGKTQDPKGSKNGNYKIDAWE